ncbi:General substrate transporter [Penicillium taxi]|uniref:General substrate transporter n=1 Tax=Penicillium taxi TaxID=168475 RepID=UPI0025451DF6|nr:General substrate transporter [Penicillium taxi]KAJ5899831.1 General substrate transporter [Penicillium taxi]
MSLPDTWLSQCWLFIYSSSRERKTLEEVDMMYVIHVPPWKSSEWTPPEPQHQLTTSQLMDRRLVEGHDKQDEELASKKQDLSHNEGNVENVAGVGPFKNFSDTISLLKTYSGQGRGRTMSRYRHGYIHI